MALYIPHSIFHLARLLYVRPETFGPYCVQHTAYKNIAPDDGLSSPKHVERILKIKSNYKNFVHIVGLYTYFKMMHGSYNIKLTLSLSFSVPLSVIVISC